MKTRIAHLGISLMLLLLATACSNNSKMSKLLDQMPADADMVAVGDIKTVIESAGGTVDGSQVTLPSYLTDGLSNSELNDIDDLKSYLKNSGIDINVCAICGNYSDWNPTIVFTLQDVDKFKKSIEDADFREKDTEEDITFYSKITFEGYDSNRFNCIAIKDNYAFFVEDWQESDRDVFKNMKRFIDDANEKSFGSTEFSKFITSGNAAGVALRIPRELRQEIRNSGMPNNLAEMYEGVICLSGNLSDNAFDIDMKWYTEDGKEKKAEDFGNLMNFSATINPQALSYMNEDEFLIYAASIKDMNWDNYMEMLEESLHLSRSDKATLTIIKSYLERIDGTVAIGTGVTNGIESIANLSKGQNFMNEFAMTMVCETKPGKAKSIVNDFKGLLDSQEIGYEDTADGFSLIIPGESEPIHVEAKEDMLILSNHDIHSSNNNPTVEKVNFADKMAAMAITLDRNNPLMKDLNVDQDLTMSFSVEPESMEMNLNLTVDGGDSSVGVIGKVAKIILNLVQQSEKLERQWNETMYGNDYYNGYYNYPYENSDTLVYVDSTAVVEDVY